MDTDTYIEDQAAWIEQVGLKDGDRVQILVPPDKNLVGFALGSPKDWKSGDILIATEAAFRHDRYGISLIRPEEEDSNAPKVFGLPFYCLVKI